MKITAVTVDVGGQDLPSLVAFQIIFGMSAVTALVAIGVAVFIPRPPTPSSVPVTSRDESVSVG